MSVLVEDMLRLSLAVPPPFAATCAPLAEDVVVSLVVFTERFELSVTVEDRSELSVTERFELSIYDRSALSVVVTDWFRLSEAVLPLLAATCAPDAPLLSEKLDERFELSVLDRFELSVFTVERLELSVAVFERFELSVLLVDRFDASVFVVVELSE